MANNYYIVGHGSLEYQGDSAGTSNLPGGFGAGVTNMTIAPNDGYMVRAQSFTIAGNAAEDQGGNQYFFNGVTQFATHRFTTEQIESILANNPDAIQVSGVSQEQLNINNGNIIYDIVMMDTMTLAFAGQELNGYNYTANTINVEVTFKDSFVFPSNNVTVKIDFDGDATLWVEPVPEGSFRWILTNKIWPNSNIGGTDNATALTAFPNRESTYTDSSGNTNLIDQSIYDANNALSAFVANGGRSTSWSAQDIVSWNEHEALGAQDSFCIENAVIRPVRQWYSHPLGYRDPNIGSDYYTNSLYPKLSNTSSPAGPKAYTWNSSELGYNTGILGDQSGLPTLNQGDNVVEKLLQTQYNTDNNVVGLGISKVKEFTPTNYSINNDGTVNYNQTSGQPESFQIRFAIHGQEGYECLVENFGVMMHGFKMASPLGSSSETFTDNYYTHNNSAIYYYKNSFASGGNMLANQSAVPTYEFLTGSNNAGIDTGLASVGTSPWLLEYAVNGYLDGSLGGGNGEALVGTWLDQRQYWSPAVFFNPKSVSLSDFTQITQTVNDGGVIDDLGFTSEAGRYTIPNSYDFLLNYGNIAITPLSADDIPENVNSGTPFCSSYIGRRDRLSSRLDMSGNIVEPYHPIGSSNTAAELDSTGNNFPSYGEDGNLTSSPPSGTPKFWLQNYSLAQESFSEGYNPVQDPVKYIILKQCDHSQILNGSLGPTQGSTGIDSKYIFQYNNTGSGTASYEYAQESGDKFIEVSIVLKDDWTWNSSLYNNADGSPTAFLTNIFGKATPIQTPSALPMPFNVELIDNLPDNNSGTITVTNEIGQNIIPIIKNSGFKNQQTVYSISGSSIKNKPKKIATVKIEAGDKKYFTRVANLKVDTLNGGNLKMIPQKNTDSIVSSAGRVTTQIFDVIYTNENQAKKKFRAAVKNKGNKTKAFLNFKETALVNRTRTIKDVSIGGSTLNPNGEIRDIVLHGSPNTSFVITLTDKNEDSIISRSNSTTVNSKGVTIPTLSDVINRRGVYKFKQRFPGLELIRRTAINGSMAASGATRIIFDNLSGVEVGDRVLMSSIGATETTTVTVLNPTGSNANECDVSRSITAADNTLARFKRPRQYDLNITPGSSLGPNMPTSDPTYTLRHYNDIVLTLKASAGTTYDITHVNSVATGFSGTGEDHSSSYIGKPNKTAAELENVSYVKKDVTLVYTLNGKGTNAFSVRTPFFSNQAAFVKAGEPYASTPTYFGGGSDWTNTIPSENGGTIVSVRELHTALSADGGTANGICTITVKFEIEKWGLENVTMDLDLDRVLTAS